MSESEDTAAGDADRGRVPSRWVFGTVAVLLLLAGGLGLAESLRWRADLVPAWIALYLATLFFANAYRRAWHQRGWLRAALRLVTALGGIASAAAIHLAEAGGGPVGVSGVLVERPASPLHRLAIPLVLAAGAMLVAHALFLGHGRRWRLLRTRRTADRRAPECPTA